MLSFIEILALKCHQGAEANAASAENATHRIKFGGSLFSDKPLGSATTCVPARQIKQAFRSVPADPARLLIQL